MLFLLPLTIKNEVLDFSPVGVPEWVVQAWSGDIPPCPMKGATSLFIWSLQLHQLNTFVLFQSNKWVQKINQLLLGMGSEYLLMGRSLVSPPFLGGFLGCKSGRHGRGDSLAKASLLWHCIRKMKSMTLPNEGLFPRDLYLGSMMWIHSSKCTDTTMGESASKASSNTASIYRPIWSAHFLVFRVQDLHPWVTEDFGST